MATLASAAGSSFVQQQRQISVEITNAASAASVGISTTPTTITDCTPSLTSLASSASSSSSSSCSSTSSSCESGVVLSGSSIGSSITNSPTCTTSSFIANATAVKTKTAATVSASTTTLMTASILPASLLAVAVTSTPPAETTMPLSSTSLSLPLLSSSYTPISSSATTTSPESVASSADQHSTTVSSNTSAHQMLLNGLSVSDADFNGTVNSSSLVEDPRALQLALELSMVGLNDSVHLQVQQQQQQLQLQQLQQQHLQHMQQQQQQLSQQHQQQQSQHQQQQSSYDMSALSAAVAAAAAAANSQAPNHSSTVTQLNQFSSTLLPGIEDRSKKSQNMTECVPVPSSEHVAEIVGRQGCKIKALRAKTNTYIKTPVRGEEPVFVVTGRKEDVAKAKREILSAAEHFSVIRASRKPSLAGSLTGSLNGAGSNAKTPPGPPSIPGQVTIQVRVPYRVVGLVVGPKGATIKHIQQETQTYIVTPSREKEPIFEVTGLPDNVQAARKQIEAHIALRTGNLSAPAIDASTAAASNGTGTVHTINSLSQILSADVSPEFLASIYKNSLCSTFDYADGCINSLNTVSTPPVSTNNMGINLNLTACSASQTLINDITSSMSIANNFQLPSGANINNDFLSSMISRSTVDDLNGHQVFGGGLNLNIHNGGNVGNGSVLSSTTTGINLNGNINHNSVVSGIGMSRSCSSASSTTSSKSANNGGGSNSSRPELSNIWKNLSDSLDVDEGIGESPSIWTLPSSLATLSSHYSPAISISPTDSLLGESNSLGQLLATQTQQQQRTTVSLNSNSNGIMPQQPHILNHNHHNLGVRRECLICGDKEITAALVPCGHNLFCMECANRICASPEGICPVCSQSVFHAMRILP